MAPRVVVRPIRASGRGRASSAGSRRKLATAPKLPKLQVVEGSSSAFAIRSATALPEVAPGERLVVRNASVSSPIAADYRGGASCARTRSQAALKLLRTRRVRLRRGASHRRLDRAVSRPDHSWISRMDLNSVGAVATPRNRFDLADWQERRCVAGRWDVAVLRAQPHTRRLGRSFPARLAST